MAQISAIIEDLLKEDGKTQWTSVGGWMGETITYTQHDLPKYLTTKFNLPRISSLYKKRLCVGGWQSGGWLNSKRIWRIWNSINAVQISPCGSHWSQEKETVSHWCHLFSYLAEEILFGKYLQNVSRETPHGILLYLY